MKAPTRTGPQAADRDDITALRTPMVRPTLELDDTKDYDVSRIAELEEAVQARDAFLAIVGHETRNPLGALAARVQNILQMARRSGQDPAENLVPRLEELDRQIRKFVRRTTTLLDVLRATTGRLELEPVSIDFVAVIREGIERVAAEAERAGCVLRVDMPDTLVDVWDPVGLDVVVTNLLSNAIKYGATQPVDVKLRADESGARFSVRDRGIGISPESQARIFERFERAVARSEHGGFGIGLWLARHFVEAAGGTIAVQSCPGEGSLFTVCLPRGTR